MPRSLRYALIALSLANLCFLSSWLVLLNPQHYTYYNWPQDPGLVEIKALVICILVLETIKLRQRYFGRAIYKSSALLKFVKNDPNYMWCVRASAYAVGRAKFVKCLR